MPQSLRLSYGDTHIHLITQYVVQFMQYDWMHAEGLY